MHCRAAAPESQPFLRSQKELKEIERDKTSGVTVKLVGANLQRLTGFVNGEPHARWVQCMPLGRLEQAAVLRAGEAQPTAYALCCWHCRAEGHSLRWRHLRCRHRTQ